jgi:hypothetical protein
MGLAEDLKALQDLREKGEMSETAAAGFRYFREGAVESVSGIAWRYSACWRPNMRVSAILFLGLLFAWPGGWPTVDLLGRFSGAAPFGSKGAVFDLAACFPRLVFPERAIPQHPNHLQVILD